MTMIVMTLLVLAALGMYVISRLVAAAWNSTTFWVIAIIVTAIMFPVTAGFSPAVLVGLVVLRFALVGRAVTTTRRGA